MKIVHVISALTRSHGGPYFALAGMVSKQVKSHKVEIVYSFNEKPNFEDLMVDFPDSVKFTGIGPCYFKIQFRFDLYNGVLQAIKGADIVHCHGVFEFIYFATALACNKLKIPFILRPCGMLDKWSLTQKPFQKKLHLATIGRFVLESTAVVHFVSKRESQDSSAVTRHRPQKVIGNGVPLNTPRSAKIQTKDESPFVLYLGRIHYKKNIEALIEVWRTTAGLPTLLLAGDGSYDYIKLLKKKSRDTLSKIEFSGPVYGKEKLSLISRAGVLALLSRHENFGNVILESLANGTPVICSPQVGLSDWIAKNNLGIVVSPDEKDKLVFGLRESLRLKSPEFSKRAQDVVGSTYSWERISEDLDHLYKELTK